MKRKVIQIGNSTQLISLPKKWCEQFSIKKGDELDLQIVGKKIEIDMGGLLTEENAVLDVTGLDRTSIIYCIRSTYRRGYDTITIRFTSPITKHFRLDREKPVISVINEEVNNLVGMEVIEQKENYCILKDISNESFEDFDIMLRRIFLLFKDTAADLLTGITNNDPILLKTIDEKHDRITIFISYCLRLLNRSGYPESFKNTTLYLIIGNLDKITDILKYASRDLIAYDKNISKEGINILKDSLSVMDVYYDFFYKFDLKKISQMYAMRQKVIAKISKLSSRTPHEELLILNNVRQIFELVVSITEAKLTFHL